MTLRTSWVVSDLPVSRRPRIGVIAVSTMAREDFANTVRSPGGYGRQILDEAAERWEGSNEEPDDDQDHVDRT